MIEDRINPKEPWRYLCDECGSVRLKATANNRRAYCGECGYSSHRVFDRKKGELVRAKNVKP